MPGELENRPLEAEDGDSNVSYRPAGPAKAGEKQPSQARAKSVTPAAAREKERPVSGSEIAGSDDARRAKILQSERYGPTSGKL